MLFYLASLSQARLKLQRATIKSDLSSTEDDDNKRNSLKKVKSFSMSPQEKSKKAQLTNSCPRFKDYISGMYYLLIQDTN